MPTRDSPSDDLPGNLLEFQRKFPDEAACARYLEQIRWPGGFVCPHDGSRGEPYRFVNRPMVLCCRSCRRDIRLTANTVMHRTKLPLEIWFWAAYLVASSTPGVSALEIQKKLGIKTYETAFQLMHKLRSAMVRPDQDKIGAEWGVGDTRRLGPRCPSTATGCRARRRTLARTAPDPGAEPGFALHRLSPRAAFYGQADVVPAVGGGRASAGGDCALTPCR